MKNRIKFAALALLAAGLFASCNPETELAGKAWTGTAISTDSDGDRYEATLTLVCSSDNEGMLFVSEDYGDPMFFCFAMPVSYTWDGGHGTATVTFSHPELGSYTWTMDLDWTKAEGLRITAPTSMSNELELPGFVNFALEGKSFAKPSTMEGKTFAAEFVENYDGWDVAFDYELRFLTATTGILNLSMSEEGVDEVESERWNINYTYKNGIGKASLFFEGETSQGGFYMPDENHILFSDGENGLMMTKQ